MHVHVIRYRLIVPVALSIALPLLPVTLAHGQFPGTRPGCYAPPPCAMPGVQGAVPSPPPAAPPEAAAPTPAVPAPSLITPEPSLPFESGLALGGSNVAVAPGMKGDLVPIPSIAFAPGKPPSSSQPRGGGLAPSARAFKITDDESPQPRDRLFFDFNYYDNVGAAVDRRLGIDIHGVAIYREMFGLEKTFLDNAASIGLRLPLNTLSANSSTPGLGGTDTDVGDLTAILKYAFWQDTAKVLSAGLAVTAPTGPSHFAGSNVPIAHDTILQPFIGYLWARERWFVHGFSGLEIPTQSRDVTILFNSLGVGYIFSRGSPDDRLLTAIVPTFEVHLSDPLSHRGAFRIFDPAGTPDVVDLTMATTFELGRRSSLSLGIVTPVTGPKPFDVEALAQFNWFFGARARNRYLAPSVIGD
jgi:hypothetical protein